jgi:thioredoxin reductase (NADPH)
MQIFFMVEKVIIIGSGPAGCAAAIYCARDGLKPLLIRGFQAGGQLTTTMAVENYPGFPSILGPSLMDKMYEHVKTQSCTVLDDDVSKVDLNNYPYTVYVDEKEYKTYSIIIASGANVRWLGLENEKRLVGKGVSNCATCDGPFFKNKDVVVVGGGDTAMEDALYLSTLAKSVTLIHRKHEFRASKVMQERVFSNPSIKIIWDSVVEDIMGKEKISGLKIKDLISGKSKTVKTDGLFIAIGHTPNTDLFKGQLDLDEEGYIETKDFTKTNKRGVFAAGDVQDRVYKQAVIAAGWGAMAAIDVRRFLSEKQLI